MPKQHTPEFVRWFRNSSPYINAFRNRTFVVAFGGEMLADAQFASLVHDLALLNSLGVRLDWFPALDPRLNSACNNARRTSSMLTACALLTTWH